MKKRVTAVILLSIIGVISICACSQKTEESNVIDIGNAYDNRKPVMASDYFSSIEYIPLETSKESLIDDVSKVIAVVADDRIIVRSYGTSRINAFDYSGRILEFNAKEGRAKDEFHGVLDILAYKDELYVVQQNKILIYDKNGNHRETIDTGTCDFFFNTPFIIEERLFGILGDDIAQKQLCIDRIDGTGKRIYGDPVVSYTVEGSKQRYINRNGMNLPLPRRMPGFICNENEEVFLIIGESIYTISKETFQKSGEYHIDYGKYVDELARKRVLFLLETPKFLMTTILFSKQRFDSPAGYIMPPFVYDYATGKTRILPYNEEFKRNGFVNDVNDDELIFLPKMCRGNKMYELIDAINFIDMAEKSKSGKIKEVASKLTEESNPVLVVGTLK